MDDIWSLLGLLFVISMPLLIVVLAIVESQRPNYWRIPVTVPDPPRGVPQNAARFFAGSEGIEDTMPMR
ncbi:hypothetical protein [Streptomyces sp. NBC_00582]|uniref:hypothetical protein n=1 Tax=Streptomyces sp. NBC_00582 TaxID=2975783 RepID=UPI002E820217|nr:hypothetical protein [Streptomyces sp. NBC_00582]WUB64589.1 hypothetical protein OG852_31415 [Streptomyces sp. NBC_00582]